MSLCFPVKILGGFYEDFHAFLLKKNINFVYLHRNIKLWIKYVIDF